MYAINPYSFTEKQAAFYTRLKRSQLCGLPIPYLQYFDKSPRYYRKEDLDKVIQNHVKNQQSKKKPKPKVRA